MVNQRRSFRMAEQIREIIALELQRTADPRFHMVTITSVALSPDMGLAKVYWVVSGSKDRIQETTEAFDAADGLFRKSVSRALKVRYVPELKFFYDDTFDVSDDVTRLLKRAEEKRSSEIEERSK